MEQRVRQDQGFMIVVWIGIFSSFLLLNSMQIHIIQPNYSKGDFFYSYHSLYPDHTPPYIFLRL